MQTPKYSKSTGGFYSAEVHGSNIPEDAVEVTAQEHAALLAGQSAGQQIFPNEAGHPALIDQPAPTAEQLAAGVRAKRNKLIAATDHLLMPDYPLSADGSLAVRSYRQALRDISKQAGFPSEIEWPSAPSQS